MENCIFCKIIVGEIPCYRVWEDDEHLAFLTIGPIREGHTLVIPKRHASYLFDLDAGAYDALMRAAKLVATKLKLVFDVPRVAVAVEGFSVDHIHVHLVPVTGANQLDPCAAVAEPDHAALAEVAKKIVHIKFQILNKRKIRPVEVGVR